MFTGFVSSHATKATIDKKENINKIEIYFGIFICKIKKYRRLTKEEKIPIFTIRFWGYSSDGRASEWHSEGQRFDPA